MPNHVDRARERIYASDQDTARSCADPRWPDRVIAQGHGMTGDAEGNLYMVETRVPVITKLVPIV